MQGFNMGRYHPPSSLDSSLENPPTRRKPPSSSSSSAKPPPTIRFETPFPLWCSHCPTPTLIPQGARHNASKRLVGHYHSTPLWSFTFRHGACSGQVEIRTDPARGDYVVHAGGTRQNKAEDREGGSLVPTGTGLILGEGEEQGRETALGRLERTIADREREVVAKERIEMLEEVEGRRWRDPYEVNGRIRRAFRVGRRKREEEQKGAEDLRERVGWGEDAVVLEGREEDEVRAGLVDFGAGGGGDGVVEALRRGLFEAEEKKGGGGEGGEKKVGGRKGKMLKKETAAERARTALGKEVLGNTRAARDPFLTGLGGGGEGLVKGPVRIPGLKRKRDIRDEGVLPPSVMNNTDKSTGAGDEGKTRIVSSSSALVSYASDSE